MNLIKAAIAGTIMALLGALLWAAIVYYGKLEIGYLAWGIGLAVGLAIAWASKGGGFVNGALAVLLTVGSILGGKYLAVQWVVGRQLQPEIEKFEARWTEEFAISYLADEVLALRGQAESDG